MGRVHGAELTARQQRWLTHLRAWQERGGTLKTYAAQEGVAVQSLYQAASDLRKRGLWPETTGERSPRRARSRDDSPGFVRVDVSPEAQSERRTWRALLPNGVLLEGAGEVNGELVAMLASL